MTQESRKQAMVELLNKLDKEYMTAFRKLANMDKDNPEYAVTRHLASWSKGQCDLLKLLLTL